MRIAFYAPLKPPTHETPSGDRRVARLYIDALKQCGHEVTLAAAFRSFERAGDAVRQRALRDEGLGRARGLCRAWSSAPADLRPQLWFTYHVYHKAPDWLGPLVSRELGIPYVIAEASHAPKRAGGPWALGFDAASDAIRRSNLLLCPIRDDMACLERLAARARLVFLPPFLDPAPFRQPSARAAIRAELSARHGLDGSLPWLVVAAMMRDGDKLASYRALGQALKQLTDLRWHLIVAGDGAARAEVEIHIESSTPGRTAFLGALDQPRLARVLSASDLYVWPGINEAYGMAMLEAQAAGVPVVSRAARGIPDVIEHGRTGLLAKGDDAHALAAQVRELLLDAPRREAMGRTAAAFVLGERSVEAAARRLDGALRAALRSVVTR